MTARPCCGPAGWAGCATRTAWPCSGGCGRRGATTGCCCSSTRHVYTLGVRARPSTCWSTRRRSAPSWSAADRGGDVTYHGPGQLVGYPILSVPMGPTPRPCHVHRIEQLVIDVLADLGPARRRPPGRLSRGVGRPRRARPAQDLRHRGAGLARPVDARLRPQRGARHGLLRPHRPVRDRRQAGHLAGRRGRRRCPWRGRGRRRGPGRRRSGATAASTARTWPGGWRPTELAPFTRGEGPGVAGGGARRRPGTAPVRMLDSGWPRPGVDPVGRCRPRRRASPSGSGSRPGWARSTGRCARPCASSTW